MIHIFQLAPVASHLASLDQIEPGIAHWIDAVAPSPEEVAALAGRFRVDAEAAERDADIEYSARVYEEGDTLYLRADFLCGHQQCHGTVPVRMILKNEVLVCLHEEDAPILRLMRMRLRHRPAPRGGALGMLLEIFALDIEHSADMLEEIHADLREMSERILSERRGSDAEAAEFIARLAQQEERNGMIRRNLMDTRRTLSYLAREHPLDKTQSKFIQQMLRDIGSLDGHTAFIFDKINFLLDATVGFINVNQNKVVKIFSVAAVAMLPPTLIASIYGMNFEHMPELAWEWGYPMALGLMLISIVTPFLYFRYKGWLK